MAETLLAAWLIARKDLAIEFRTRSAFLSAVVFALLGLVIFYYSWDPTAVAVTDLAPGVLWIVFTFSGLLGLHRSFGVESADHAMDGLLASPVSREAIFLGKAMANLIFVVAVQPDRAPRGQLRRPLTALREPSGVRVYPAIADGFGLSRFPSPESPHGSPRDYRVKRGRLRPALSG